LNIAFAVSPFFIKNGIRFVIGHAGSDLYKTGRVIIGIASICETAGHLLEDISTPAAQGSGIDPRLNGHFGSEIQGTGIVDINQVAAPVQGKRIAVSV
jgi:hypothetical protein